MPSQDLGGRLRGYATAMWLSFGEALAAVAGALVGLLFVAVSVKGARLTEEAEDEVVRRGRA